MNGKLNKHFLYVLLAVVLMGILAPVKRISHPTSIYQKQGIPEYCSLKVKNNRSMT